MKNVYVIKLHGSDKETIIRELKQRYEDIKNQEIKKGQFSLAEKAAHLADIDMAIKAIQTGKSEYFKI